MILGKLKPNPKCSVFLVRVMVGLFWPAVLLEDMKHIPLDESIFYVFVAVSTSAMIGTYRNRKIRATGWFTEMIQITFHSECSRRSLELVSEPLHTHLQKNLQDGSF